LQEARTAAKAMFALSKVAQNGGFSGLEIPLRYVEAVPETYRGWLTKPSRSRGEDPAPQGGRFFVHFLDEFRSEIVGPAIDRAAAEVFGGPIDAGVRSLIDRSYIWHAPSSGRSRVADLTSEGKRVDEMAQRQVIDLLLSKPRPDAGEARPLCLYDFDGIVASVRGFVRRGRNVDWARLVGLGDWDGDEALKVRAVLDLAVAKAIDRFPTDAGSPVAVLVAKLAREHELVRVGYCAASSACEQPGGSSVLSGCACSRLMEMTGPPPTGRNSSRDVRKGLVALQIAAQQLVKGYGHDLEPVSSLRVAQSEPPDLPVSGDSDAGLAAIGRLIQLQDARIQHGRFEERDADLLSDAAAALDRIDSREILEAVAAIAATAVVAAGARVNPGDEALDEALMYLARTVAGAFRELRRPAQVLNVLSPLNFYLPIGSPIGLAHLRHLEAHQDLQLALQRTQNWALAASTYRRAQETLDEYQRSLAEQKNPNSQALVRKALEVREQLMLGRVGGLVLQGEAELRAGSLADAAAALNTADGLATRLESELEQLDRLEADERSSELGAFLRYGSRWQVMPALMRYRTAVARMMIETVRADSTRQARTMSRRAAREARHRVANLQRHPSKLLTARHEWEFNRIELVAALLDEDIDFVELVQLVGEAGGDDGGVGDYVVPMMRWALREESMVRRWAGGAELSAAIAAMAVSEQPSVPRLPDLGSAPQ
jgi:hypothetical protein